MNKGHRQGFTLIELLVAIAIIAVLATVVVLIAYPGLKKARDAKRKIEVQQLGRLLAYSCFVPDSGPGDYDLKPLVQELIEKFPKYGSLLQQVPRDPSRGTDTESFYRYAVDGNHKCALYANLENEDEEVTLPGAHTPSPGSGTGILAATSTGWNSSTKYYQASN